VSKRNELKIKKKKKEKREKREERGHFHKKKGGYMYKDK
jgi:hypothetical protein